MYIYICIYIYMYIYICIYICYVYICIYICIYIYNSQKQLFTKILFTYLFTEIIEKKIWFKDIQLIYRY